MPWNPPLCWSQGPFQAVLVFGDSISLHNCLSKSRVVRGAAQTILMCVKEVEAEFRGQFSSIETALQNVCGFSSYVTTMMFYRLEQFCWPVLESCGIIPVSAVLYASFVRQRRGHVLHIHDCVKYPRTRHSPISNTYELEEDP